MRQHQTSCTIRTPGPGLTDITKAAVTAVADAGAHVGLLTAFVQHTSASLVVQENADPDVLADLQDFFARVAPAGAGYRHDAEGPDDMPAHIKSALTQTSIGIPIIAGRLALGTWQGLYLFEHRARPHTRTVVFHVMGE